MKRYALIVSKEINLKTLYVAKTNSTVPVNPEESSKDDASKKN